MTGDRCAMSPTSLEDGKQKRWASAGQQEIEPGRAVDDRAAQDESSEKRRRQNRLSENAVRGETGERGRRSSAKERKDGCRRHRRLGTTDHKPEADLSTSNTRLLLHQGSQKRNILQLPALRGPVAKRSRSSVPKARRMNQTSGGRHCGDLAAMGTLWQAL